jgi:hypothetical protein
VRVTVRLGNVLCVFLVTRLPRARVQDRPPATTADGWRRPASCVSGVH